MSAEQRQAYQRIAGPNADLVELSPETCECPTKEERRSPVPQPVPVPAPERAPLLKPSGLEVALLGIALAALVLDDLTGVGAADDELIPVVLGRLAMAF